MIDLSSIFNNQNEKIDISNEYIIDKKMYKDSEILNLSPIVVNGYIYKELEEGIDFQLNIKCNIKGKMTIRDSVSLEEVDYPFSIDYDDIVDENWINNEKLLDIFIFLWENIVLEVPLQFTKVSDLSKFHGDGWRLISEEQLKLKNNPFSDLLKDFEEE